MSSVIDNLRPLALSVSPSAIPADLVALPRWVLWRYELREGKWTKPPYQPSGTRAKSTASATWNPYEIAWDAYLVGDWDGIGIALNGDGLMGIDLDHCCSLETGEVESWARDIVARFSSYTEISPSGTGLRIFCYGTLPPGGRRKGQIEIYDDGRYLTVTGHRQNDALASIERRQEIINAFHQELFSSPVPQVAPPQRTPNLSDDAILQRAMTAANGPKFMALWGGNINGYASASEADIALCTLLSFWTGCDSVVVDRLFRQCKLYRPGKWDERHFSGGETYGQHTLAKAVASSGSYNDEGAKRNVLKDCGLIDAAGQPLMDYHAGQAHLKAFKDQITFGNITYQDIQRLWGGVWHKKSAQTIAFPQETTPLDALDALGVIPKSLGIAGLGDLPAGVYFLAEERQPVFIGLRKDLHSWHSVATVLAHEFRHVVPHFGAKQWDIGVWPWLVKSIIETQSQAEETWAMLDSFFTGHAGQITVNEVDIHSQQGLRNFEEKATQGIELFHQPVHCNGHVVVSAHELMNYARGIDWGGIDTVRGWRVRLTEIGVQWQRLEWRSGGGVHRHASVALIPQESTKV